MSSDKYPSIFSRQMKAIVYILCMILIHVFEQIIDYKANCVN